MAKNSKGIVFVVILVVGLFFLMFAFVAQQTAVAGSSPEVLATCSTGKWAISENASGGFNCANVPYSTQTCNASICSLNNATEAVIIIGPTMFPLLDLPNVATKVSYYISNNSTSSIAAGINPVSNGVFLYINGNTYCKPGGCPNSNFELGVGQQILIWSDGTNWNGIITGESSASCNSGQFATSENNLGVFSCGSPNITFQNSTKICTDTTATTVLMAGFKLNYTTVGTGKVTVSINFQLTTPATASLTTKYRIAFGTGTAPACNAAVTGTKVGNSFPTSTVAAVGSNQTIDLSVGVLTLSASTTYWFDVQMFDSSGASWTYSNPQMTVLES